jgi:hypothetical protein
MVIRIGATPPDVPLRAPSCTGYADVPLHVAAGISGLVSACVNPAAYAPDVMVIYNLSDDVLGIRSASASQPALRPYYPASDSQLPSGARIETYTQDESVRGLSPRGGTVLLPVGGRVIATQDVPIQLAVQVNRHASADSYAAQVITGYVVDNLTRQIPQASALSYELGIAGCVSRAHALWHGLYERPPPDAAVTMQAALSTIPACQDLQKKVISDHAEQLSIAAAGGWLSAHALQADLARVAQAAGQPSWESHLDGLPQVSVTIAEAGH